MPVCILEIYDVVKAPAGGIDLKSCTVVTLEEGHSMERFRVDRSRMTHLFVEFFFFTENKDPWKFRELVFSIVPAWRRSSMKSPNWGFICWLKRRYGGGREAHPTWDHTLQFCGTKYPHSTDWPKGANLPPTMTSLTTRIGVLAILTTGSLRVFTASSSRTPYHFLRRFERPSGWGGFSQTGSILVLPILHTRRNSILPPLRGWKVSSVFYPLPFRCSRRLLRRPYGAVSSCPELEPRISLVFGLRDHHFNRLNIK